MSAERGDSVVTPEERRRVEVLRDDLGIPGTAKALGMSRDSVLRILASAPVHRGTVLVLREALKNLSESAGGAE